MSSIPELIERVQKGQSTVELVYMSQSRWPVSPHSSRNFQQALKVSILDSSFNPPTLAHLELAQTHFPAGAPGSHPLEDGDYDARLLLLSVRNADKVLKPGDATHVQRLEMMILLAKQMERNIGDGPAANVAVAIIDEPTFVSKSRVLSAFIRERLLLDPDTFVGPEPSDFVDRAVIQQPLKIQPVFLMGTDTLERLVAPRYYSSEEAMNEALRLWLSRNGDNARVVCAWRLMPNNSKGPEDKTVKAVEGFVQDGRVLLIDIGEEFSALSSSEVRDLRLHNDLVWTQKVIPSIAEYIVEHDLYTDSS